MYPLVARFVDRSVDRMTLIRVILLLCRELPRVT